MILLFIEMNLQANLYVFFSLENLSLGRFYLELQLLRIFRKFKNIIPKNVEKRQIIVCGN